MANRRFTQFYNTLHKMPVQLDCNFIVDPANGNGLGIRSLKGPGIANVFMNTSAPLTGSGNPNPIAGYIYVQFQDNYNYYYFGSSGFVSPLSGSNIAVDASDALLTAGHVYTITVVGTSTAADWIALGVPKGISPAPGVSFVALATGAGAGNGQVQSSATAGSGIDNIEVIGNPNTTLSYQGGTVLGSKGGSYMILACYAATNSSTTTKIVKAPATGSVVGLSFVFSNSRITQQGD